MTATLRDLMADFRPEDAVEAEHASRLVELATNTEDPWRRELPLHVTASALIVHPATARVLLRWHKRQQAWLITGGHGDPGETDPVAIAIREGREETGLKDLVPWPSAKIVHVAIVRVPGNDVEPAHEHADVRFLLATGDPSAAQAESPDAPLRWLTVPEALA